MGKSCAVEAGARGMKVMERRLRRLEDFRVSHAAEPDLAALIRERRRQRLIAEGREPEPDPPFEDDISDVDSEGRQRGLGDFILKYRRRRIESREACREAE